MKLTVPQRYVLQTCIDHGGVLEVGGIDGANVKTAVVNRCAARGWLSYWPTSSVHGCGYRITPAGRAVLARTATQPLPPGNS